MKSVTPPEAQQGRLVLLQTNDFPKDRMNNVKIYIPERRASKEAQTIVTRSFDTRNQQSDAEQSNGTYTAPGAKEWQAAILNI